MARRKGRRKKVINVKNRIKKEEILEEILKLLRVDSEFRAQLLGIIAEHFPTKAEFALILEEIKKLREDFEKYVKDTNKRFEEINKRFEEMREDMNRRFEDINKRFEDINKRFEDINKRFEDMNRRFEEMREDFHKAVTSIGSRWGVDAEAVFREAINKILSKYYGAEAKETFIEDKEGIVKGRPATYQVDLLITDTVHILIDVKSQANDFDVLKLHRLGKIYEKDKGVKPRLILVCVLARKEAIDEAKILSDVEIITRPREEFKP